MNSSLNDANVIVKSKPEARTPGMYVIAWSDKPQERIYAAAGYPVIAENLCYASTGVTGMDTAVAEDIATYLPYFDFPGDPGRYYYADIDIVARASPRRGYDIKTLSVADLYGVVDHQAFMATMFNFSPKKQGVLKMNDRLDTWFGECRQPLLEVVRSKCMSRLSVTIEPLALRRT